MATEKSLPSILLGGWSWPEAAGSGLNFKEDGKGGMSCGDWPRYWIAAEFEWKPIGDSASSLEQVVDFGKDFDATFDIEVTLTKRVMPEAQNDAFEGFNEVHITDTAFRARTYKVQLTKKIFAQADYSIFKLRSVTPLSDEKGWYGMRIVFDKSPYPLVEEWRQDTGGMWKGAQERRFWEYKNFFRETEESKELWRVDETERAERKRAVLVRAARLHRERETESSQLPQVSEIVDKWGNNSSNLNKIAR